MKDKSFKYKRPRTRDPQEDERIRRWVGDDEAKFQFIRWANGTHLDIAGIHGGEPVFRPAICAWEAWKAAWALRSPAEQ